jgi:phosphate transport system permease protein
VVLGFWGIIVFAPVVAQRVEPPLHTVLGWTGLFGAPQQTGISMFTASVILAVMIIPIVASLSRDLFMSVPSELVDGAEALGATRWEVIRGVVIPTTFGGVVSAVMLGLGRALGEALAVALTIGGGSVIHADLFGTGYTLAGRIAQEIEYVINPMHGHALYYLALILLVIGVATNLLARLIARRYAPTLR